MLSRRFEHLFRRLVSAFIAYDDASRSVDQLRELAATRIELDRARSEIADERIALEQKMRRTHAFSRTAFSDDDLAVIRVQGMISN